MQSNRIEVSFPEKVVTQGFDGESILYDLETEVFYRLNQTGALVIELINEYRDFDRVIAMIAERFKVDPELVRRDANCLLVKLEELGLLTVTRAAVE